MTRFTPRIHEDTGGNCCCSYSRTGEPTPHPTPCPKCREHFAALEAANPLPEVTAAQARDASDYAPPNGYEAPLHALAAALPPLSPFAAEYRAAGLRDLEERRAKRDAEEPEPWLAAAADLSRYAPPDPYREAIRALKEKERR